MVGTISMRGALRAGFAGTALLFLAACLETTGGGGTATPALGGASGAAGDEVFTRDEKGCLYQRIEGTLVPIVDERGRKECSRLG